MGVKNKSRSNLCKRVGRNITNNPKFDIIVDKHKKNKRRSKPSEYSRQLTEKQLARYIYWVSEKQFKKLFDKSIKSDWITGSELLKNLEIRLDNFVYRSWIASSRSQARQVVAHGHFELNGHKVTIPSITVKIWDKLILRSKMHSSPFYVWFWEINSSKWIKVDKKNKAIEMTRLPENDDVEQGINTQLIVEYYSR